MSQTLSHFTVIALWDDTLHTYTNTFYCSSFEEAAQLAVDEVKLYYGDGEPDEGTDEYVEDYFIVVAVLAGKPPAIYSRRGPKIDRRIQTLM